jgi:hypothetical protein
VKKWCKACKKTERDTRKDFYRKMDEDRQKEIEIMQDQLFREARLNSAQEEQKKQGYLSYILGEEE